MTNTTTNIQPYPFEQIRFQWLELLANDTALNDIAVRVGLIIQKHYNKEKGKAWPSLTQIAKLCGKEKRTIQRAIKLLEEQHWFKIVRGSGINHGNQYVPHESKIIEATKLRNKNDKNDTFHSKERADRCQKHPEEVTIFTNARCQKCHPIKDNIYNKKINTRAYSKTLPFITLGNIAADGQWRNWLTKQGLPSPEGAGIITYNSYLKRMGFYAPSQFPPRATEATIKAIQYFKNLKFIAEEPTRDKNNSCSQQTHECAA